MKQSSSRFATRFCLWLPMAAVILKNIFLQSYIVGENPFTPNVLSGFAVTLPYLPLQIAVTALLFLPMLFFRGRGRYRYGIITDAVLSVIVYIDIVYYRSYSVIPAAIMLPVAGSQGGRSSIIDLLPTLLVWLDLLLLVDFIVWGIVYGVAHRHGSLQTEFPRRPRLAAVVAAISAVVVALIPLLRVCGTAKEPFRRLFVVCDTVEQSRYFSSAGYHVADLVQTAFGKVTEAEPTDDDDKQLEAYFAWRNADTPTEDTHRGIFKGKNLIVLQVESLESFVIGLSVQGQEITPHLNRLAAGGYYFPNINEQVKSGNSSDCDFMLMTSLLPPNKSYAFGSYDGDAYYSLPMRLKDAGYSSRYYHGVVHATWNYEGMLSGAMHMDRLIMDYQQDEQINGYLTDASFVRQTLQKLEADRPSEPFYAHMVTCSSHIPFDTVEGYEGLKLTGELAENPLGNYFCALHYADEQIGILLDGMQRLGLLDNTVLMLVGDHGGVHKYYPHYINLLSEDTYEDCFGRDDNYSVPLIFWSRDISDPQQRDVIAGQVDILPTLLYAMGINETDGGVLFGRNLFCTSRSFFVRDDGLLRGTLSDEDYAIVQTSYYLSDLLIRSNRVRTPILIKK